MTVTPEEPELPRFEMLGPVRAWRGDTELDLGPAKQRAVLITLLINANRPVPTERIVDAVWADEPPENGANVVQKYVAGLRRVLEPDRSPRSPGSLLTLTDAGYQLSVGPDRLDADVFHGLVRQAHAMLAAGRPADAGALLVRALGLWRGPALAGLSGALFDAARDRLTEGRASALEAWAGLQLRLGHHVPLAPRLAELVAEFPLREELRYQLMLALYRCGRQPEALAAFRAARQLFADEFGVEPGERLQELHRAILRADPALAGPVMAQPVAPLMPPPPPPAQSAQVRYWVIRVVALVVPVLTLGVGSWATVTIFAARRRSWKLGGVALGLLSLVVLFAYGMEADGPQEDPGPWADVGLLALIVAMVGGIAAGATISPRRADSEPDPSVVFALSQKVRRDQARQLVSHHPGIARELRIGRPDLPRAFDDGGLVDVNTAPEIVIASLPGIGPEAARRILDDRYHRGSLASVDELVTRNLIPRQVARALHDTLVAVPTQ
ncbi:BTAD domain-containing putative transcriptional regulator [Dactylosporangium sp. NPDC051541]|uniref:BTAD domain-containing putative transcriptional regulator n=1 Tax=Dactylosporangium sp. NPDC051541 TaxID=3363977 RepID=UPI0037A93535